MVRCLETLNRATEYHALDSTCQIFEPTTAQSDNSHEFLVDHNMHAVSFLVCYGFNHGDISYLPEMLFERWVSGRGSCDPGEKWRASAPASSHHFWRYVGCVRSGLWQILCLERSTRRSRIKIKLSEGASIQVRRTVRSTYLIAPTR